MCYVYFSCVLSNFLSTHMHSHIGHICMVFLQYGVGCAQSIWPWYKIVYRSIHKRVAGYQDEKVHDTSVHLHRCYPQFFKKKKGVDQVGSSWTVKFRDKKLWITFSCSLEWLWTRGTNIFSFSDMNNFMIFQRMFTTSSKITLITLEWPFHCVYLSHMIIKEWFSTCSVIT